MLKRAAISYRIFYFSTGRLSDICGELIWSPWIRSTNFDDPKLKVCFVIDLVYCLNENRNHDVSLIFDELTFPMIV